MKYTKRIEIDWEDSVAHKGIWDDIEDVVAEYKKNGLEKMKTLGYAVEKNKDYIIVCQSLHFNEDKTVSRGADFFIIPTGCIKKIKYI